MVVEKKMPDWFLFLNLERKVWNEKFGTKSLKRKVWNEKSGNIFQQMFQRLKFPFSPALSDNALMIIDLFF